MTPKPIYTLVALLSIAILYIYNQKHNKPNFSPVSAETQAPRLVINDQGEITNAGDLLEDIEWDKGKKSIIVFSPEPFLVVSPYPRMYKGECLLEATLLRGTEPAYKERVIYNIKPTEESEWLSIRGRVER